jgi:hypothetical protein
MIFASNIKVEDLRPNLYIQVVMYLPKKLILCHHLYSRTYGTVSVFFSYFLKLAIRVVGTLRWMCRVRKVFVLHIISELKDVPRTVGTSRVSYLIS